MNGRVYDPSIGKFLSADPFIQFPESTQGFNRYAYVGNNPLSFSDPSGHFIQILAAAVLAKLEVSLATQVLTMAVAGYIESGGNLKAAIISGLSTGISAGIGGELGHQLSWGDKGFLTRALLHAGTQGGLSAAGGGRFGDGFLGALSSSLMSPMTRNIQNPIGEVLMSSIVGGTVSVIGGGKFANGARSAAFVYAFNDLNRWFKTKSQAMYAQKRDVEEKFREINRPVEPGEPDHTAALRDTPVGGQVVSVSSVPHSMHRELGVEPNSFAIRAPDVVQPTGFGYAFGGDSVAPLSEKVVALVVSDPRPVMTTELRQFYEQSSVNLGGAPVHVTTRDMNTSVVTMKPEGYSHCYVGSGPGQGSGC